MGKMILRLGEIDNKEKKFIPTKKEYLKEYLDSLKQIEEYELLQTYKDGIKYRRYNDNGDLKYTKNNKREGITVVKEIDEVTFNKVLEMSPNAIRKIRKYYGI
ncbi:hypothetical protein D3C72_2176460 [compost metagenome]